LDRRDRLWRGLLAGHWLRRRSGGRRANERHPVVRDTHSAHWLAAGVLVLALSVLDAILTLTLIHNHGAQEVNPFMAPLVDGSGGQAFAWWKLGLTIFGVVVLIQLAHVRLFGLLPAGVLLYLALLGYVVLIPYEWQLLSAPATDVVSSGPEHPLH
jgi:hypothetical protein